MDQKANSIADLAAVLVQQDVGPSEDKKAAAERRMERVAQLKLQKRKKIVDKHPVNVGQELQGVEGVSVRWLDILDAEYAETWPAGVIHDTLQKTRHTIAHTSWRVGDEDVGGEQQIEETPSKPGWREWIMERIPRRRSGAIAGA